MNAYTAKQIQASAHPDIKKLFWNLFGATRGASNRIKIMSFLKRRPSNPNQVSKHIGVDYKGVIFHLKILEENNLVEKFGNRGATTFFVSPLFEENEKVFDEIIVKA